MPEQHPDQRYIEGLRKEDAAILKEIYQSYRNKIVKWVSSNSGTVDDGEDLFQETLLTIFDRIHQPPPLELTSSFYAYFHGIARRKWFKRLNKEKGVRKKQEPEYIDKSEESIEEELIKAEAASERFFTLEKALQQLSERCQKLIHLFFYKMLGPEEIVKELSLKSTNTYYKAKKDCLDRLKTLI